MEIQTIKKGRDCSRPFLRQLNGLTSGLLLGQNRDLLALLEFTRFVT